MQLVQQTLRRCSQLSVMQLRYLCPCTLAICYYNTSSFFLSTSCLYPVYHRLHLCSQRRHLPWNLRLLHLHTHLFCIIFTTAPSSTCDGHLTQHSTMDDSATHTSSICRRMRITGHAAQCHCWTIPRCSDQALHTWKRSRLTQHLTPLNKDCRRRANADYEWRYVYCCSSLLTAEIGQLLTDVPPWFSRSTLSCNASPIHKAYIILQQLYLQHHHS